MVPTCQASFPTIFDRHEPELVMIASRRCRKAKALPTKKSPSPPLSPPLSSSSTNVSRSWSWNCSNQAPSDVDDAPISPIGDDEYQRISKARRRLAQREVELRQIIRHCNEEMDFVRRKLCNDLGIMEILKGEIEKAGTGPMREELEMDFHNGM